jgi:putative addiction module component (TIGR02574 family)
MQYPTPTELRELSPADRMRLLEDVWDTFVNAPDSLPISEYHEEIVDSRLEAWRRDPGRSTSWEVVQRRITGT